MSTTEYLKSLDIDQLRFARDLADDLIKAKEAEPRTPIWIVSSDVRNVGGFLPHDYAKAVERAHQLLDEEAKHGTGFIVQIESERRESEIPELLELSI